MGLVSSTHLILYCSSAITDTLTRLGLTLGRREGEGEARGGSGRGGRRSKKRKCIELDFHFPKKMFPANSL